MVQQTSFVEWDFEETWIINEGITYPWLQGNPQDPPPVPPQLNSIEEAINTVKGVHFLEQNYPNPFNPITTIRYEIPEESRVMVEVFDILGRRMAVLVNEVKMSGTYDVSWDASRAASGMYIYRIQAGDYNSIPIHDAGQIEGPSSLSNFFAISRISRECSRR